MVLLLSVTHTHSFLLTTMRMRFFVKPWRNFARIKTWRTMWRQYDIAPTRNSLVEPKRNPFLVHLVKNISAKCAKLGHVVLSNHWWLNLCTLKNAIPSVLCGSLWADPKISMWSIQSTPKLVWLKNSKISKVFVSLDQLNKIFFSQKCCSSPGYPDPFPTA